MTFSAIVVETRAKALLGRLLALIDKKESPSSILDFITHKANKEFQVILPNFESYKSRGIISEADFNKILETILEISDDKFKEKTNVFFHENPHVFYNVFGPPLRSSPPPMQAVVDSWVKDLLAAIRTKDAQQVVDYLALHPNLSYGALNDSIDGVTPLLAALESGSVDILQALLDRQVNVNFQILMHHGYTALMVYLMRCPYPEIHLVAKLLKVSDLEVVTAQGDSLLSCATGHPQILTMVVKKACETDKKSDLFQNWMFAATRHDRADIVDILVHADRGMDIDVLYYSMLLAILNQSSKILEFLFTCIDPEKVPNIPWVALCMESALFNVKPMGCEPVNDYVRIFLDRDYTVPLAVGAVVGSEEALLPMLWVLLGQNLDVNFKKTNSLSPLTIAAIAGWPQITSLLIQRGAVVDAGDEQQPCALFALVEVIVRRIYANESNEALEPFIKTMELLILAGASTDTAIQFISGRIRELQSIRSVSPTNLDIFLDILKLPADADTANLIYAMERLISQIAHLKEQYVFVCTRRVFEGFSIEERYPLTRAASGYDSGFDTSMSSSPGMMSASPDSDFHVEARSRAFSCTLSPSPGRGSLSPFDDEGMTPARPYTPAFQAMGSARGVASQEDALMIPSRAPAPSPLGRRGSGYPGAW